MKEAYRTSAFRGVVIGALVGAAGFFSVWSQTDELKTLITAGCVPAITTWLGFLGYGALDAQKQ